MKKVDKKNLKLIAINFILLIVSVFTYTYIYKVETGKRIYAVKSEKFIEENQNPVFKINKIILYSSANAIDNSDGELKDIDISQFTDMEIYINNKNRNEEITGENTVNELYIDNIKIDSNSINGEKILNYKNPLNCGKFSDLKNWEGDGILFNVITSNEKNNDANYDENIFYTDCSNPISLGYINKDILTGCEVTSTSGSISFDGSILKNANIELETLNTNISFTIHLTNNYNEKFICNVSIDNDLAGEGEKLYSGYFMKILNLDNAEYNFIKISD